MKRPFLLLVLSLFKSASGELRQPLVDICRSRTSDDVSFRLCVTNCGKMSPTNQISAHSADVNGVEDLFRQFGSDGDIEAERGSAYEVPECFLDPEGSGSSPPGSGDTEEQVGVRSQREDDEKDDESASFALDFEKSSDFGDLKKRLTSFVRESQQDLPDKPFARHRISAEEVELMHADSQELNLFPVSPAPKIAKNREGSFLHIAKQGSIISGQVEPATEDAGSKENGSTRWNNVENRTDENSELAKRLIGTEDSNGGDLRLFGEEERTENSFIGVGESAFEESKRQSFAHIGKTQSDLEEVADSSLMSAGEFSREEKRPSFVRVGKSLHEEKRPSFVRVGKSLSMDKRPSFVRVGKSFHEEKRPSFVRVGKRPSFVRVGKSLHEEKRPSFVRVGKSLHEEKRPSFVRVGKSLREEKRPSFVRVGKSLHEEKRPSFVRVGKSLSVDKRPSFVHVGKSFNKEKRPSFVRVGKSLHEEKRPSFVRVGKSFLRDIGDEDHTGLMSSVVGIERNFDKTRAKRQSFVRIGKSLFQAAQPQSNPLPSHSNNVRDSFDLAGRQQTQQQHEPEAFPIR